MFPGPGKQGCSHQARHSRALESGAKGQASPGQGKPSAAQAGPWTSADSLSVCLTLVLEMVVCTVPVRVLVNSGGDKGLANGASALPEKRQQILRHL